MLLKKKSSSTTKFYTRKKNPDVFKQSTLKQDNISDISVLFYNFYNDFNFISQCEMDDKIPC